MKNKWIVWVIVALALIAGAYLGFKPGSRATNVEANGTPVMYEFYTDW